MNLYKLIDFDDAIPIAKYVNLIFHSLPFFLINRHT